jgi:hypothetical protein
MLPVPLDHPGGTARQTCLRGHDATDTAAQQIQRAEATRIAGRERPGPQARPRAAADVLSGRCRSERRHPVGVSPRVRKREVERETGFEPATFCLGSRYSAS